MCPYQIGDCPTPYPTRSEIGDPLLVWGVLSTRWPGGGGFTTPGLTDVPRLDGVRVLVS